MKFDKGFVVDLLTCSKIRTCVSSIGFPVLHDKSFVSHISHLQSTDVGIFLYVDFVDLNISDEVHRRDEMLF